MEQTGLIKFDAAIHAIEIAKSIDEVKAIRDKAKACEVYAKQIGISLEGQNSLAEIRLRAERKAGAMLKEMDRYRNIDNLPNIPKSHDVTSGPTLKDMEITPMQSSRWQQEARIDDEVFEDYIKKTKKKGEVTTSGLLRVVRAEPVPVEDLPDDKFRVIYADPPWSYGNQMPVHSVSSQGDYYPLMTIKQLCELPVGDITAKNAVLFLWVTSPILEESFSVIKAWGFKYKASFVWDKIKHNMGHYNSVRHEFLLICTKGSCPLDNKKLFDSVQSIERTEHSVKPERFREIIDTIYPKGKRIELFSRKKTNGWDTYGNDPRVRKES